MGCSESAEAQPESKGLNKESTAPPACNDASAKHHTSAAGEQLLATHPSKPAGTIAFPKDDRFGALQWIEVLSRMLHSIRGTGQCWVKDWRVMLNALRVIQKS